MNGPAGVMSLVLAETVAGAIAFLFLTPLWNEVRRGFFLLVGAIVAALALGTAAAANAGYDPSAAGGRAPIWLALSLGGATLVWLALLAVRRPPLARIVGALAVELASCMPGAMAGGCHE